VLLLSIDTCDARGSVAVLRDRDILQTEAHDSVEDYSSWLLPAVDRVLSACGLALSEVDAFVAASGPGSFTGLRVGLTTVKAWAEVFGKPVAGVSRLQGLGFQYAGDAHRVAAFIDARRGQLFGALFGRVNGTLICLGDQMVIDPARFVQYVAASASGQRVAWVSLDADLIVDTPQWRERAALGEQIQSVTPVLAPTIGLLGFDALTEGRAVDVLALDANYVRRSDAEIFAKTGAVSSK
jgi:tRNA threonylcarbamoyladenosine biosynthesis protein TsaB